MHSAKWSAVVPVLLIGSTYAKCAADDCLRAMRATQTPGRLDAAQSFCAKFTATATVAPTAIPAFATDACKANQNGDSRYRLSSACGCIATATPAPTAAVNPCALASSAYASQIAISPAAVPTVAAQIAHDCLLSVPLGQQAAVELIDSIEPYLEWQSDATYLANPPADYPYPGFSIFENLAAIRAKLVAGEYNGEYAYQDDLYKTVVAPAHDGHYVYYPDLYTLPFTWVRRYSLVSISEDGQSLPVIKVHEDVVSSPATASIVDLINGIDAATYLANTAYSASWNEDADSAYNGMFFELSGPPAGLGIGYYSGGGRINHIYQGPTTTLTFANGTEVVLDNYARILNSLDGITDGADMYEVFCNPNGYAPNTTVVAEALTTNFTGYPTPIVATKDGVVLGYYLDGEGFEDVAVITLLAFESESPAEFQAVTQKFFADAVAAGKTKLVIDFQQNAGGYILQGYSFYLELFPHLTPDGFSRWKDSDSYYALAQIISNRVAGLDPYTSDNADLVGDWESWFNYRYDLNITNEPFASFDDKFGPYIYEDTKYTNIMRWNLNDNLTTINQTYGLGIEISGYGSLANISQPFDPENIVILYDGVCASTCTLASEFLRIQGGVQSIAMGGRPQAGPIQGVGGVKGSQVLQWSSIYSFNQYGLQYATTDTQKAALSRYNDLALNRSTIAAVNVRDQILRDNVDDGLPAQFVREEADCRLYWTEPMVTDVTQVWKAAANSAFNGAACNAGAITKGNLPAGARQKRSQGWQNMLPGNRLDRRDILNSVTEPGSIKDKHILKAIP